MEDEADRIDGLFEGREQISYDFVKTFLVCFRWVFNAAFIGIPWLVISAIAFLWKGKKTKATNGKAMKFTDTALQYFTTQEICEVSKFRIVESAILK